MNIPVHRLHRSTSDGQDFRGRRSVYHHGREDGCVERKEEGRMYKPILVMTTTMALKTAAKRVTDYNSEESPLSETSH